MKTNLFALVLFLVCCSSLLANANQDQKRVKVQTSHLKDSVNAAIIQKQDSMIRLNDQIASLAKNKAPENKIDSVTNKKNILETQIHDLEKINIPTGEEDVQSTTLSISTLVFGVVLILFVFLFRNKTNTNDAYYTYKLIGIVFIGTVSVFLIPAGFDNAQITPVVGLLGTLAGYLAGTSHQNTTTQQSGNDNK